MKSIIRDIELSKITDDSLVGKSLVIQEFFDKIFNGLEIITLDKYPDSIFFVKNNTEFYMEQNSKGKKLYCSYNKIWSFFKNNFECNDQEISDLVKYMVEEQLKCRVSTPSTPLWGRNLLVEEKLKCRVSTPYHTFWPKLVQVEEQLKNKVFTPKQNK